MKKIILILTSLVFSFSIFSCASKKTVETKTSDSSAAEVKNSVENTEPELTKRDTLSKNIDDSIQVEAEIGETIKVTGILQKGNPCFYVEQNEGSKSAVTITITDTQASDTELSELVGKKVTITGKLTASVSPWNKEVKFISVE